MLQVLHDLAREVGADKGGPLIRAGSEADAAAPTCRRRRVRTATAGGAGPARVVAAMRQQQQQQCMDRCDSSVQAGELHSCVVGPPRQSGSQRRGARVPSVSRLHPGKCVACAVSCYM
jgi:3-methyladenine DNA glycosylase Mpg